VCAGKGSEGGAEDKVGGHSGKESFHTINKKGAVILKHATSLACLFTEVIQ
jgi:hypothetical protein